MWYRYLRSSPQSVAPKKFSAKARPLRIEPLECRVVLSGLSAVSGSLVAAAIEPSPDGLLTWQVVAPRGTAPRPLLKFGLNSTPDRALIGSLLQPGELNAVITRPDNSNGLSAWFIDSNGDPVPEAAFWFGFSTDTTLIGDLMNRGRSGPVAVRQQPNGVMGWFSTVDLNSTAEMYIQYGRNGGKPLLADVNEDRRPDRVVAYPQINGLLRWEADTNQDQITDWVFAEYGFNGEDITAADANGDGKTDIGVIRRYPDGSLHGLFTTNGDNLAEVDIFLGGPTARAVQLPSEPIGDFATDSFRGVVDWQQGTTHRGATIKPAMLLSFAAIDELQARNVNLLRVMLIKEPGSPADYGTWLEQQLSWVTQSIPNLRARGLSILLSLHSAPGSALAGQPGQTDGPFVSPVYRQQFLDTWRVIAGRYAGTEEVVGFDILNEPRTNSPSQWNALARDVHHAIRGVGGRNATRTIIVESRFGHASKIGELRPADFVGSNVVYSFHAYDPLGFTHYGLDRDFRNKAFSTDVRRSVERTLAAVRNWQVRNRVRIYVGEFAASVLPTHDNARRQAVADFLAFSTGRMEAYGWNWTYHAFREANVWDLEIIFGSDAALWNRSTIRSRFVHNPAVF